MAKRRWYHDIDISNFSAGGPGQRIVRRQAQNRAYYALRSERALGGSVLKSGMPTSMINRIAAERRAKAGLKRGELLRRAGFAGQDDPQQAAARDAAERRQAANAGGRGILGHLGRGIGWFGRAIYEGGKMQLRSAADALTFAGNLIETPIAAGGASDDPELGWLSDQLAGLDEVFSPQDDGSVGGSILSNLNPARLAITAAGAGTAAAQGGVDFWQGVNRLRPGTPGEISDQQREQMELAGHNPDSALDRYRFYYNDWFDGGRNVVADHQITRAREAGMSENEIDSAVELVVSGAADEASGINIQSLSPATQEWVQTLTGPPSEAKSRAERVFGVIADEAALQPGATYARSLGYEPGDPAYRSSVAIADLALLWYVDPLGRAGDAVSAARAARFAVRADQLAEIPRVIAASDENGRALHGTGRAIDEMLNTADQVYLLQQRGNPDDIVRASRLRETFNRRHRDMSEMFDVALSTRSGEVSSWAPRATPEASARETQRGLQFRRPAAPLEAAPSTGRPAWQLRNAPDEAVERATLAEHRARFAEDMLNLIVGDAIQGGRPLHRGRIMLPGQVSMGARLRGAGARIFETMARQDGDLMRAIRETADDPRAVARMEDAAGGTEEFNIRTGQWVTQIRPRGFGVKAMINRGQALTERSFSGHPLTFHDNRGTEVMRRLVAQFMPRRQAYAFMNEWSSRNPAGRYALYQELTTSMVESTGMRSNGQIGRRMAEYLTRGVVSDGNDTISGTQANARLFHNYASPLRNTIRTERGEMAAGLWPHQMADGVRLPSYADMKIATGRTVLVNKLLGIQRGQIADRVESFLGAGRSLNSAWKSGKTGTFGNMWRQILEGVTFQTALDIGALLRLPAARRQQALRNIGTRLARNEAQRGASQLTTSDDWTESIIELQRVEADPEEFRRLLIKQGENAGLSYERARVMALMTENLDGLDALADAGGVRGGRLFLAGPMDWIRRQRLNLAARTGLPNSNTLWSKWVDERTLNEVMASAERELTARHQGGMILRPGENLDPANNPNTSMEDAKAAAEVGLSGHLVRIPARVPNAHVQVPATGDMGALKWSETLDRLQSDEIAGPLLRYVAHQWGDLPRLQRQADDELTRTLRREVPREDQSVREIGRQVRDARNRLEAARRANASEARLAKLQSEVDRLSVEADDLTEIGVGLRFGERRQELRPSETFGRMLAEAGDETFDPTVVTNAQEYAADLINRSDVMRNNAMRLMYDADGRFIPPENVQARADNALRVASDQVEELQHLLGIRRVDGELQAPDEIVPVLQRIAKGQPVRAKDLRDVPDELRPPEVHSHTFVPDIGKGNQRNKLARAAIGYYDFFVGKPMARLWTQPLFQVQVDESFRLLEPLAERMVAKGMSHEVAGETLLHMAVKRATAMVFNTTDNVNDRTMFTELADNHFVFLRAMENFFQRLGRTVSYNPGRVARQWLWVEAASTSGMIYEKPVDNEQGDTTELYFVYPGSAMMARITADALRSLGIGKDGVMQPVFAGVEAPVKFLNPTLQNPIGTSANPMFGASLRVFRALAPNTWTPGINQMIAGIEGGEEFFAQTNAWRHILPSNLTRFVDGMNPLDMNGKLMSNTFFAIRAAAAAGALPGPNATSQEHQDAVNSVRVAAHNALVWRTLFGMFGPAVGLQDDFEVGDGELPSPSILARQNGIDSVLDEWWEVLNDSSERYGSDAGFTRATEEWIRRYPRGRLIYNPDALMVGSSQLVNAGMDDRKGIPRTNQAVSFLMDNAEVMNEHGSLLPFLLPAVSDGAFDTEANRLMTAMGVLERKDTEHFYNQVVNAAYINEWWDRMEQFQLNGGLGDDWYAFDAEWRQMYPVAAMEKDRRSDPDYVHGVLANDLAGLIEANPPSLSHLMPQMRRLHDDYRAYRQEYLRTPPDERYFVNADYRESGNRRWSATPLEDMWRAFAVFEGNR